MTKKHNVTYQGGEYTPSTENVRSGYIEGMEGFAGVTSFEYRADFDRWLEAVRAEAKAEAWDEGAEAEASASCINPPCGVCDGCATPVENPYKESE